MRSTRANLPEPLLSQPRSARYRMFGLLVDSQFRLPFAPVTDHPKTGADVRFVCGERSLRWASPIGHPIAEIACHCPTHLGRTVLRVYRHAGDVWIWYAGAGLCHLGPDGDLVHVFPEDEMELDGRVLGLVLSGIVSSFLLHQRGSLCLHASSVVLGSGAVVFLGVKGKGKSTIASGFLQRGGVLLTDDILPLQALPDAWYGLPSVPVMKLWKSSIDHVLGIDDPLPDVLPNLNKKLLALDDRYAFAQRPTPIRAIYILDRVESASTTQPAVALTPVAPRDALMTLIAQTALRPYLTPQETTCLLQPFTQLVHQAPVRLLRYPSGFRFQPQVLDRVLDDLERCA